MFGGTPSGGSGFSFGQNKPSAGFSFGSNTNNNTNTNTGSTSGGFSFGGTSNNNAGANSGGSLFGGNNNATGSTGFSFGGSSNPTTNNTATTGSLFGAKPATAGFGNNNAIAPASTFGSGSGPGAGTGTGGFSFGNSNNNNANTTTTSGGLFGNKAIAPSGTSGSLFGNNSNTIAPATGNNLFGGSSTTAPAVGGGLFGSKPGATAAGTSLFGNNNASSSFGFGTKPAATNGSLFGGNTGTSLFGQQQLQPQQQQLQFGQFGQQQQQQPLGQEIPQLTGMTKVLDLPLPVQEELKQLDEYIQTQVSIAEYLKNQEFAHRELIVSVPRDINYLEKNFASTNQALTADLKFIESFKGKTLESFNNWVEKLIKVFLQLTNPMSNSGNDQGQDQGSMKIIIGVSGNRTESPQQQQQQQQQQQINKSASINVTAVLNSFFISKIEDFKYSIGKYELILQEVENCVNDLDASNIATSEYKGGLETIVRTLQEEFKLYVELTNEFAEIHHNISKLSADNNKF